MPDITDQTAVADSTPQEAAQNIQGSKFFNIPADSFKNYKEELQPEVDNFKKPPEASRTVASYIQQGPEQTALATPDVPKLGMIEGAIRSFSEAFGTRPDNQKKINELNLKKMNSDGKLSEQDSFQLDLLNQQNAELDRTAPKGAINDIASAVGGFASDVGQTVNKHAELIASATAISASTAAFASAPAAALAGPGAPLVLGGAALAGAAGGFASTVGVSMLADQYENQTASIYGQLSSMAKPDGTPLNMDENTKKKLAIGTATVTTAIQAAVGIGVAKTVPFLNKFINGRVAGELVMDPANAALRQTIFNIAAGTTEGAFGGASQETVKMVQEEMANNYDGTEASFTNALETVAQKIKSGEANKRLAVAGAAGGIIAGSLSAAGNVANYGNIKKGIQAENVNTVLNKMQDEANFRNSREAGPDESVAIGDRGPQLPPDQGGPTDIIPQRLNAQDREALAHATPEQKSIDALNFESTVENVVKASNSTEMAKLAPEELADLQKKMLDDAGIDTVHLDKETLTKAADNEKKAQAVLNLLDSSGRAAAARNATIQVPAHQFIQLVAQHPEFSGEAKLTPEGPTANQAKAFLEEKVKAHETRQELMKQLGESETTPEQKDIIDRALNPKQPSRVYPSNDVFGEPDYLDQTGLSKAMEEVLPKGTAENYLKADLKARQSVVDNINDTAKYEMDQVRDNTVEEARDAELQAQTERATNNPNLAIVDRFTKTFEMTPDARFNDPDVMLANHAKKGFSPLAIDPRQLNETQRTEFLENDQLKKHKVFVKGGISPEDSARLIGVGSGDDLLRILSQTPSREELIANRTAAREADIQQNSIDSVNLNDTAIEKAYQATLDNALSVLNHLKNKEWPALKGAIKKIALRPPTKREVVYQAQTAIQKSTVGSLNVNQFKVGERKSQRMAVEAITSGQGEKAFVNYKAVVENIALAKETQLAIGKINRVQKLFRRMQRSDIQAELKEAGHGSGDMYSKALNEMLDSFNLTQSKKGTAEQGAYNKWVEQMVKDGEGDFTIPERMSDIRQSIKDMTVEQVLLLGDRAKAILQTARMKNKLYKKHETIKSLQTVEAFAEVLSDKAKEMYDYDEAKIKAPQQNDAINPLRKAARTLVGIKSSMERSQHLIAKLDGDKVVGPWNELILKPLFDADEDTNKLMIDLNHQHKKIIEKFGKKEFTNLRAEIIQPKELADMPSLQDSDGKISKAELLKGLLNMGNEGNIEYVERTFGVSAETFMQVTQRELDFKHMEYAQDVWDMFKSLEPELKALQERTRSEDFVPVQPKPLLFTKDGKTRELPGGYFPVQTLSDEVKIQSERLAGAGELNRLEKFRQKYYADAQTEQGHLERRSGGTEILNLDISGVGFGLAQTAHDLKTREAVRDTVKLLTDPTIRDAMVAGIGANGRQTITDTVINFAQAGETNDMSKTGNFFQKIFNHTAGGMQSVAIVGKVSSIIIQSASLPISLHRMGPTGLKHFGKIVYLFNRNPNLIKSYYEVAGEIHPAIRNTNENFEGDIAHAFNKVFGKSYGGFSKSPLRNGRDFVLEHGFEALQHADQFLKVLIVNASFSQAINGDVPGIEAGDYEASKIYASNLTRGTLTHNSVLDRSPLQNVKYMKPVMMFFTDANIKYNNYISATRRTKGAFKSGKYGQGAVIAGSFMVAMAMGKLLEDTLHKQQTPFDGSDSGDDSQTEKIAKYFLSAPAQDFISTLPIARDIDFALSSWKENKTVILPFNKQINDFTMSISGLNHFLQAGIDGVNSKERKAMIMTAGYAFHLPAQSFYNNVIKPDYSDTIQNTKGLITQVSGRIDRFLKKEDGNASVPQEFKDQLKQLQEQLNPVKTAATAIPDDALATIKQIQSGGKWNAYNQKTGAAGIYQFTEKEWNDIRQKAPELDLTENGRGSRDTAQQEKAMTWLTKENAKSLEFANLEVTSENLYAARILGDKKAVSVLNAPANTKIKSLVGEEFLADNELKNSTKVSAFKEWLGKKVMKASLESSQASVDKPGN